MRKDVYAHIAAKPMLIRFLREQPIWYRRLSRKPADVWKMEKEAKQYFQQTLPHKVERLVQTIDMAKMMMAMMKMMNDAHN